MSNKTHWKKMTNPNYFGAWDLDGDVKTFTIANVKNKIVKNAQGKDDCVVVYLDGAKPLIANKTNLTTIAKVIGSPYIEDWVGKEISLHTEKVRAFETVTDAVRVMDKVVHEEAIPCEECGQVLKSGFGMSVKELKSYTEKKYGKTLCAECATKAKESK